MTTVGTRVSPGWLRLREPADAAARSAELARAVADDLPGGGPIVVHDLGCGSGSMGRWLAPMLRGRQRWVLHDLDPDLLALAAGDPPPSGADGAAVTVDTRLGDLGSLRHEDLAGASLVTASALLDILTSAELDHLVECGVAAQCPVLLTLSVTGRVALSPGDPLDGTIRAAFNDHQRRTASGRALLGGDAVGHAAERFRSLGADVRVAPSPWRLDARSRSLTREWLQGWVGAACEQRPELATAASAYLARRDADLEAGRLRVSVDHLDLLARPRGGSR
jgi:hypothetical protein